MDQGDADAFLSGLTYDYPEVIRPALSEGRVVLSDRFALSTAAYQMAGRGLPAVTHEQAGPGRATRPGDPRHQRERLRDRLAAVGEMAAVMAHEIKNPLAGIEVLAGLLRRSGPRAAAGVGHLDARVPRTRRPSRSSDWAGPSSTRTSRAGPCPGSAPSSSGSGGSPVRVGFS